MHARETREDWRKQTTLAPRARHLCKLQEAERSPAELMETPHAHGWRRQSHTETKAGARTHTHTHREMNRGRLIQEGAEKHSEGKRNTKTRKITPPNTHKLPKGKWLFLNKCPCIVFS